MSAPSPLRARALLALAALAAAGCAEPDDGYPGFERALEALLATVATSSGDLTVKHAAQGVWEPCGTAAPLFPGDWLRTGKGASAHVEFVGGGALDLEEEAVVVIEALKPIERTRPDSPDSAPLVAVQSGSIRSTLSDRKGGARPLLLRAADGAETRLDRRTEAGPAELRVASVKGETELAVAQGEVSVASGGTAEVVVSGSGAAVGRGGVRKLAMPARPAWRSPGPDARVKAGDVALAWAAGDASASFRLQASRDATFRQVESARDVDQPEATLALAPGVHHLRVAARDPSGRQGPWSAPRRVYAEREAPVDALLEPAPGAAFGYADGPPRIALKWSPREGARAYRVVVSKTADLSGAAVVSEVTAESALRVDSLSPGEYFWGVYVQGAGLEPIFLAPRQLTVKKVSGSAIVAPKRIQKWGQ